MASCETAYNFGEFTNPEYRYLDKVDEPRSSSSVDSNSRVGNLHILPYPKDEVPPEVVLFEGINKSGKTHAANYLMEKYPKQFEYVKFPYFKENIDNIIRLFQLLEVSRSEQEDEHGKYWGGFIVGEGQESIIQAIHDTFDLDFRQWSWDFMDYRKKKEEGKVYIFDRYWPSNIVYSNLRGHMRSIYAVNHLVKPKLVILFEVHHSRQGYYEKLFPKSMSTINMPLDKQMLTPDMLLYTGQEAYKTTLYRGLMTKSFEHFEVIPALEKITNRELENILKLHRLLTT